MFYVWLVLAIVLAIIEMLTINLVSIWFVASSLVAMIISIFTDSLFIQISVFVIVGVLLLIFTKDLVKKFIPTNTKTNIDRIIGMTGIVTEKITKNNPGEVKVDGKRWTAVSDKTIDKDETVKILEINSTKLKVERTEE